MDEQGEYELLPHEELEYLRREIARLKEDPLQGTAQADDLKQAVDRLTLTLNKFISLMTKTNEELLDQFQQTSFMEQFARINENQEQIAKGIVSIARLLKPETPQQSVAVQSQQPVPSQPAPSSQQPVQQSSFSQSSFPPQDTFANSFPPPQFSPPQEEPAVNLMSQPQWRPPQQARPQQPPSQFSPSQVPPSDSSIPYSTEKPQSAAPDSSPPQASSLPPPPPQKRGLFHFGK